MAYRILSLSGGGIRGLFQAVYLREAAKDLPKPLSSNFDLVAGTSTGAIIALAVALDIDPARMVKLFQVEGPKVFRPRCCAWMRTGSKYSGRPLRQALESVFKDSRLKDCRTDVVIAATVLNRYQCRSFSTQCQAGLTNHDADLLAVDAAMASCAAPVFFPPVRPEGEERTYVDGGIWANTPSLLAVMHAHHLAGIRFSDIRLVSIGNGEMTNGTDPAVFSKLRPRSAALMSAIYDLMFATQSAITDEFTETLIGENHILPVNIHLDKPISLDDVPAALAKLPSMAEYVARNTIEELSAFLLSATVAGPRPVAAVLPDDAAPVDRPTSRVNP